MASYALLRTHATDQAAMRDLIDGTGTCVECGYPCEPGEFLCDPCAADAEPATAECFSCGVEVDADTLDAEDDCLSCHSAAYQRERDAEFRDDE